MKIRRTIRLVIAVTGALVGISAHGSYVVEANGAGLNGGAIASGADFDFVTHDFGIESAEAIQIALTHMSNAPNLHGNLLLWSVPAESEVPPESFAPDATASAESTATSGSIAVEGGEDFSYYDAEIPVVTADANVHGSQDAAADQPLPVSVQNLPVINTDRIFWILKPAEFTSFSQMTAARFGF